MKRGYQEIRPATANRGDIIRITRHEYSENVGSGCYTDNFIAVVRYMVLTDTPSNNGNVKVKDSKGRITWLNTSVGRMKTYRKEGI